MGRLVFCLRDEEMFEAIGAKVLSGIVSLSMFLFSSYTGNDPSLRPVSVTMSSSYLQVKTQLDNAFTNDFPEVFRSGVDIPVFFRVEVKSDGNVVYRRTHRSNVKFDPMQGEFTLQQTGTGLTHTYTSYQAMLSAVSTLECSIPLGTNWKTVTISVESYLPEVEFTQIRRRVDLMVLWKYKRPKTSTLFNLLRIY